MTEPVQELADLPSETRQFLEDLSPDDVKTFKAALPIIRAIVGFGKVTKWLAITLLGLLAGVVLLGESVAKIIGWLRQSSG